MLGMLENSEYLLKNLINLSAGYEYFYQLLYERLDVVSDNIRGLGRSRASSTSSYNRKKITGHSKLFTALQQSYRSVGEYENSRRIKLLRNRIYSSDAEVSDSDFKRFRYCGSFDSLHTFYIGS